MEKPALTLSMRCVTRCVQIMYVCLLFDVLWLTMTIFFWIRIQLIPIAMVMTVSLEIAGRARILRFDAVTASDVYHICTLPFAIFLHFLLFATPLVMNDAFISQPVGLVCRCWVRAAHKPLQGPFS